MGVIVRSADVGAGVVNPNIWAGSVFEYARTNGLISIGIVQPETAAAGPVAGLLATINIGADVVAEEFAIPTSDPAISGRNAPLIPDDFYFQDAAAQGDRIVTSIRNPTGGALAFSGVAIFTPAR